MKYDQKCLTYPSEHRTYQRTLCRPIRRWLRYTINRVYIQTDEPFYDVDCDLFKQSKSD